MGPLFVCSLIPAYTLNLSSKSRFSDCKCDIENIPSLSVMMGVTFYAKNLSLYSPRKVSHLAFKAMLYNFPTHYESR